MATPTWRWNTVVHSGHEVGEAVCHDGESPSLQPLQRQEFLTDWIFVKEADSEEPHENIM